MQNIPSPQIVEDELPALPPGEGFTLSSFNILLPNSWDGWWVYKYYDPSVAEAHRAWPHREKLLTNYIEALRPDIFCAQEACAETFEENFAFMAKSGYGVELHRKFRFRTATFWRQDRFELVEAKHKNRVLVTVLRSKRGSQRTIYLANCHLTAGPSPDKRLREIFEAIDQIRKESARRSEPRPSIVLCGDFNATPNDTAVRRLLLESSVPAGFCEPAYPKITTTSKGKSHPLGAFMDVYEHAYGAQTRPATLVARPIARLYVDESGALTPQFKDCVQRVFELHAVEGVMDRPAVDRWLTAINRQCERGSELRAAERIFEASGAQQLKPHDLLEIYIEALSEGKYWSVHHDFSTLGVAPKPLKARPYEACLDYIFCSPQTLSVEAVRAPLNAAQRKLVFENRDGVPNAWHPSDHLPLAAAFHWRSPE